MGSDFAFTRAHTHTHTHLCRNQTKQITPVDCVAQRHRDNEDAGTRNTSSGHRAIKTRKCQDTMIVS